MNKIINRIVILAFMIVMVFSISACQQNKSENFVENKDAITLIADLSYEWDDDLDENQKERIVEIEEEPTIGIIAQALSNWTKLDFTLADFNVHNQKAYVSWDIGSTLIEGPRELKENPIFQFEDLSHLNFFMMNSLAQSIQKNFPIEEVYYAQENGEPLLISMDEEGWFFEIDQNKPYVGSCLMRAFKDENEVMTSAVQRKVNEAKQEDYDLPIRDVPVFVPDILGIRDTYYTEMPTFATQNEVSKYVLYKFLNNQFELEFYLTKDFATDEATGFGILSDACEGAMSYYLFSAYRNIDLYTQDQGHEDKVYAKIKIAYTRPEYDLEARAEALEFTLKNPIPDGGFKNYEEERAYALKIHDYIAKKVTYSPIGYDPESMFGLEKYEAFQEAYNVLGENQNEAVCAAYARAFALIAHYADINTVYVLGNQTEIESHAWNVIYPMDGSEAVLVDVTWDDTESNDVPGQDRVSEQYFYVPLSQEYEHNPSENMEEFVKFMNLKRKSTIVNTHKDR